MRLTLGDLYPCLTNRLPGLQSQGMRLEKSAEAIVNIPLKGRIF